jgi:hypothetical protein
MNRIMIDELHVRSINDRTHNSIAWDSTLRWTTFYICWDARIEVIPLDTQSS